MLKDDNLTGFNDDVDGGNNDRAQIINTKRSRRRNRHDETATSTSSASRDVASKQLDSEDGNSIKYRTCSWQKVKPLWIKDVYELSRVEGDITLEQMEQINHCRHPPLKPQGETKYFPS